jgi:hypothetical protein
MNSYSTSGALYQGYECAPPNANSLGENHHLSDVEQTFHC